VTVAKTKVTIASAMAVGYKAPNGQLITVLLSDKPANAKESATDTRIGAGESFFEGAWKSQHAGKRLAGFMFTIGPKGTLMTEEFLVGGQNNTFMIGSAEYVLDLKSTSPSARSRRRSRRLTSGAGARPASTRRSISRWEHPGNRARVRAGSQPPRTVVPGGESNPHAPRGTRF
jgi:hypothetical protein